MFASLYAFLQALPELMKLVQTIQKKIEEEETDKKVKHDVKTITEAFNEKDPDKLRKLFDSE